MGRKEGILALKIKNEQKHQKGDEYPYNFKNLSPPESGLLI